MRNRIVTLLLLLLCGTALAHASVALFLEEPYGTFGGMNPTGHAAIYLSHVLCCFPSFSAAVQPRRAGGCDQPL